VGVTEVASRLAFDAFVRTQHRSLFGTAFLLTGAADRAEELVQDTLAMLYPKWDRVATADDQLAYVRRALANRFVSVGRRRAHSEIIMWELPEPAQANDVADAVVNREAIWQLLNSIAERQRAAIVLRYFHDLPDDEIADCLGCRTATVRSLISRGVADMRQRARGDDVDSVIAPRRDQR
jgi:RNA polymerase sigma-70 factor (sigma-E family)